MLRTEKISNKNSFDILDRMVNDHYSEIFCKLEMFLVSIPEMT